MELRTWERPREGKMTLKRHEVHRGARILKFWPEDDQESVRFPVLTCVRSGQTDFRLGNYVVQCRGGGHFLLLPDGMVPNFLFVFRSDNIADERKLENHRYAAWRSKRSKPGLELMLAN